MARCWRDAPARPATTPGRAEGCADDDEQCSRWNHPLASSAGVYAIGASHDITRELGSAVGVALLGAALTARYRHAITPAVASFPPPIAAAADAGIGRAIGVAAQQHSRPQADALIDAARRAFVDGGPTSMWIGAAAVGLLFVFLVLRAPRRATSAVPALDLEGTT